jgi:phage shock protein A
MLDKVESPLSDDRKANLTQARAFMQQAEEALKKEELTLARSLAERAQNIAKLLISR